MSTSRTTLRLITILFLLAGILLLRKPVFGQPITAEPTRFSVVIEGRALQAKAPTSSLSQVSPTHATSSASPNTPSSQQFHRR